MAANTLHRLAGTLRRTCSAARLADVPDAELLARFRRDRDPAAFEAVVRRHGPLVLAACRKVLPDPADADDTFQATFLVLLGNPDAVRAAPSLGSWLYGVAHRTALRAARSRERRDRLHRKAGRSVEVGPPDLSWREAVGVLHEELDALPDRYRLPLLHCYLEGLTRDEAAAQLGWRVDVLRGRLERGREKLRNRLTRRGVTLSTGLLAAVTARSDATPTPTLVGTTLAAAGKPSPAVAALVRAVSPAASKGKAVLTSLILVGLIGVGLGGNGRPSAKPDDPPPAKPAPAGAKPADQPTERTITGKVLGPDGKPVAGAELVLQPLDSAPTVVGKTAADGTFKVTVPLKEPGAWLVPRAAGYGIDFMMPATNTPTEVTFKLVKDTPIRSRIVDTQGRPVAGVEITVRSIVTFQGESLDTLIKGWATRDDHAPLGGEDRYLTLQPKAQPFLAATTDADGRFTIPYVGTERMVSLKLRGGGIAETWVTVLTRPGFDPALLNKVTHDRAKDDPLYLANTPLLHGPEQPIVAEAEKVIRGVVKETDTGAVRPGVEVTLEGNHTRSYGPIRATTDANGRYEIRGAKKAAEYRLSVKRDPKAGTLGRTVTVRDTTGFEPLTADIGVAKGIVLTGRVTDGKTGRPVRGFACVGIVSDNQSAKSRPEFDSPDCYDRADTDADGVYRTVVVPGPVLLMAGPYPTGKGDEHKAYLMYRQRRFDPDYPQYFRRDGFEGFLSPDGGTTVIQGQYSKVLKIDPKDREVRADVVLERASEFPVKLRDPDGKPVEGAVAAGVIDMNWMYAIPCAGDTCTVYELDRAKPRLVVVAAPDRGLAGSVTLKGDEAPPVTLTLAPTGTVTGKLVDPDGKPLAGVPVRIGYEKREADEIDRRHRERREADGKPVLTAADGSFTYPAVIPGLKFQVYARVGSRFFEPTDGGRKHRHAVKSGETADLGTIPMRSQ